MAKGHRLIDLTGCKFGRLTVLRKATEVGAPHIKWLCRCECGTKKEIRGETLRNGKTRSCGCLQREVVSESMKLYHRDEGHFLSY